MSHDVVMQGSDLTGVSSSTASAALALTALSAGSEDRKLPEPIIAKHSPPYMPPLPLPAPYPLPGIHGSVCSLIQVDNEYNKTRHQIPSRPVYYPDLSSLTALDKNSLKRKLPKK
jgi:hypothetical protein